MTYIAAYLVTAVNLGGVSSGGYLYIFWLYQNPADFAYSLLKVIVMGTVITFVGCYYGYHARGGSVGVGRNTATPTVYRNGMEIHTASTRVAGLLRWGNAASPTGAA
jgi:phospholipid/cholesterol/gamma-HCH transport system permease protein